MKSTSLLAAAVIICLSFASHSYSQVQTPRPISVSGACGGYYEYLPQGYNTTTSNYPIIIAVHGIGELGNGSSDLPNILNCWTALPRLIENGGFPSSFTVGGQNFSFIVLSPQFRWWPSGSDVNDVIDFAIKNYRVDQSRIYVTGLSMGGGAVWDFAGSYPSKAAAVVPICGAAGPDASKAQAIANAKLGVWATHNQDDPTVSSSNTTGWVSLLTQYGADVRSNIFPVSGHDAWTKTYDPGFTQNGVNIYQWMLMHQRGNTTPPPPNQPPTANAGADQNITLPQNSVTLSGSGTDPDGTIAFYEWSQFSGPSQASVASVYTPGTAISNLVQGTYVFTLKVTDDKGATATSNVTIKVNPAPAVSNQPPTANAGADQTVTLPINSINLSGSGSDPDGIISFYEWKQASGPAQSNIASPYSANTLVSNLVQGSYVFTLKVTDNNGATDTSNVTITVNATAPSVNQPPTANAGSNQTIALPQNSVTLSGSGSDPDGTISFYEWSQISGPALATIVSSYTASTVVNNLSEGSFVFTLKVTDDKGATATSNVTIKVNPAPAVSNQPPTANAGADQTITLPQNSVTLSGSGTDPDGSIVAYQWMQISGPSQANIVAVSSANTVVNNLIRGAYTFKVTVEDNAGAKTSDEVTITVNEEPNKPPIAKAGSDQTIILPLSFVILRGSGLDSDGSISSYQWTQISGPSKANIAAASSATTVVDSLKQGVYILRFTVTDNKGATGSDEVTITVNRPPNQAPITNAGTDQTVTLPVNSVDLAGAVSDSDGTIISYQWTQISGPSKTSFSTASPLAMTVHNLVEGIYTFRLTATDNDGAVAWDDVKVTVLPDPRRQSTAMLYPNPATNIVNVRIDAVTLQTNTVIRIINSAGDVVYLESFMRTNFRALKQVDISKLPKGTYFLTVTADINTTATLTFIKQ